MPNRWIQTLRQSFASLGSSSGLAGSSWLLSLGLCSLLLGLGLGGLWLVTVRRRPEGEVVAEELHDKSAVAVRLLGQRVELGNGVVESLLGKMASTVWRVEDLVVEDGEVQGETETDWVSRCELGLSDVGSVLSQGVRHALPDMNDAVLRTL